VARIEAKLNFGLQASNHAVAQGLPDFCGHCFVNHSKKISLDVSEVRRYLEPGPIVLVSSRHRGVNNIMTMGWHTVMEFSPSLIGCIISSASHSHGMIRSSGQCVINIPDISLAKTATLIGTSTGTEIDKFAEFKLTPANATTVDAPLIAECFANFECRVVDKTFVKKYDFFVLEVLKAHVRTSPKYPETIHYRGDGIFMTSGKHIRFPSLRKAGL
jgi:flavin reductase (DIM6/NTAB) family NADH-FMN oxidoreductase RutF